jgi:hypothetical protein
MMKIDVSYEALLQALVEAIRDERDHGTAMMSLVSRLVEDACQQDWFETHWKTNARLRLAQMACGRMPKDWRSAAPVLEVIAEGVRWALKADEIDSESRAILLAIIRLADVERRMQTVTGPKPRHVAKSARRRKANGAGAVRRGRRAARAARPVASPQAVADHKAGPTAAKTAPARKAKRSKPVSRAQTPAQSAKPLASPKPAIRKMRPTAAKTALARKAKRSKPVSRAQTPAQLAKAAASAQAAIRKTRPTVVKTAATRKAKRAKSATRSHTPAQVANLPAPAHPAAVAKAPSPAKTAPARKPNGVGQGNPKLGAPAITT